MTQKLRKQVQANNKKIFNKTADALSDKRAHGYTVNNHAMKLMHYRFIEQNHDAVVEAGLEQIALKKKRHAAYKKDITCECGAWKGKPFKFCKNCYMKTKNVAA